jgi:methionine biosynthesis protein MetW
MFKTNAESAAPPKYHLDDFFDPARAHPDEAHSVLMRLIPSGAKVLELGCASGYLSGYMERALGCRVTGLEADPAATAIAATRCSEVHTVDLDSLTALEVARASAPYDLLLAAAVLEHLKYPERLLTNVHTMLKPGAWLIISLPNIAHWSLRLKLLRGQFDYADYGVMDRTHLHLYTLKTGRELIESRGYQVDSIHIAGSALQNWLNRLARRSGLPLPHPVLPRLLAYELIYLAHKV